VILPSSNNGAAFTPELNNPNQTDAAQRPR
jgi:hypothetical protein